jgi:hypothetical protein
MTSTLTTNIVSLSQQSLSQALQALSWKTKMELSIAVISRCPAGMLSVEPFPLKPKLKKNGEVHFSVTFGEGPAKGLEIVPTLKSLSQTVRDIILRFRQLTQYP